MLNYSVVITSYLRSDLVELTLKSILTQDRLPLEVIIVDNNVLERESNLLKDLISKTGQSVCPIKKIKTPKNSAALARYMGACASKGDLILFMDNDVVIESDYSSKLIKNFEIDPEVIGIQGVDKRRISGQKNRKDSSIFKKFLINIIEFLEISEVVGSKQSKVSPSICLFHPDVTKEFEVYSQWISLCASFYRKDAFKYSNFPQNFVTYSNSEYIYFSYDLYKQKVGKLIYTSKAKYTNIDTEDGRLPTIPLTYQLEVNDYYIFLKLFPKSLKNILIFTKSRIGRFLYNFARALLKKSFSLNLVFHSFGASLYPLINFNKIRKGDLSFYEKDFT